jgi:hypothetical protein
MKIEKPKVSHFVDGKGEILRVDFEGTLESFAHCIGSLVDAHNAKEPNEEPKVAVGPMMTVSEFADFIVKIVKEDKKDVSRGPEPKPCEHDWHYNPDGYAEQCSAAICSKCKEKGCRCDVPKDQIARFDKDFDDNYKKEFGPEPKPEALRDGDAFIGEHGIVYVQVADKIRMASTNKVSSDIHIANILSLAAAVKEHGLDIPAILAAVQRGEVSVMLTKDEMESIVHVRKEQGDPNRISANQKLRKAIGGDK